MKNVMRILVAVIMVITVSACSTHQGLMTAQRHQAESVKANKKQARGLKKASEIVNARNSQKAYGN